jgi:hypothetical protein
MNGKMTPGPARDNQTTLGSGCVCPSGCDSCDRLAEAWSAMVEALTGVLADAALSRNLMMQPHLQLAAAREEQARAALTLARRVTCRGQDQTRYADHVKHGAGWKDITADRLYEALNELINKMMDATR